MNPKKAARHFPDDGCADPPPGRAHSPETPDLAKMKQEIGILLEQIRKKVAESPKKVAVVVSEWMKRPAGQPAPKAPAPAAGDKPKPPKAA